MAPKPYNPLARENLATGVTEALLARPVEPLPPDKEFSGAGLYAIYYTGDFKPYLFLAKRNRGGKFAHPIYVGKAAPSGSRKGRRSQGRTQSNELHKRLVEHAQSVMEASNLDQKHFHCRFLVVDEIWIPLGESLLIDRFSPLWNVIIAGFGNHDPGGGRRVQKRSAWDVLHPGRKWVEKQGKGSRERAVLVREIQAYGRRYSGHT